MNVTVNQSIHQYMQETTRGRGRQSITTKEKKKKKKRRRRRRSAITGRRRTRSRQEREEAEDETMVMIAQKQSTAIHSIIFKQRRPVTTTSAWKLREAGSSSGVRSVVALLFWVDLRSGREKPAIAAHKKMFY